MKILLSWVAAMHDFQKENNERGNKVNLSGPTFNYHKEFYKNDKHVILCQGRADEPNPKVELLRSELNKVFNEHFVEVYYIDVLDVIDIDEIRSKVESYLLKFHKDDDIDIFFSPGTSAMQISWYLIHESSAFKTSLFQVRPAVHSKSSKPELLQITTEKSTIPLSSLMKERSLDSHVENYKITQSLKPIYNKARLIAAADSVTSLIYGESGVGKEHLANFIHKESSRAEKPFIAVNCSALTDELLSSQLFGHKKGAFTGAIEDKIGFFEEARGGSVFLDEIGDISPFMQQSLLRVIQEKKIIGVGATKERKIDVRVIAATNKDLPGLCAEGKFRWDLYYRLTVTELTLPSLRERNEVERRELIDFFLKTKKKIFKRTKQLLLDKEVFHLILKYKFPGNVRELENLIESFYVYNEKNVSVDSVPSRILAPKEEDKLDLVSVERSHIAKVLKMTNSNAEAARLLGIAINTLKAKLKNV
ncbi:sigma-54-dependent Fis family transcriptional regulator [Sphingobacterium kitahiroshimense]|uniref:RNA repair transcriptional activator RtcR family protein n=1 Tax=Sphingobacterium sp. B16(2022) TaxID=2914044 RepID=UPI00143AB8A6|nr:RNA repair transcriptional activator RtcR family protein [Sphingobacterium sp. B16(2022)]NJI73205.1 sigma-54-dependent Fis family transcriptional regulator [Sphingobacterium sp. B16(2022)]